MTCAVALESMHESGSGEMCHTRRPRTRHTETLCKVPLESSFGLNDRSRRLGVGHCWQRT